MTVRVQQHDFDVSEEIKALTGSNTDIGAVVTFTGTVRGTAEGKPVHTMTLEHYPEMTLKELETIDAQAKARWPLYGTTIIHRYGTLKPGDAIVLVIATSAHRAAAFEAASFLMDYLKTRAPFWKKEQTGTDEASWVDARENDDAASKRWESQ